MLELLAYLRANGFKTFIVSGGGIEFMRPWTERVYGIPPEQVVGSRIKTKFEMRDGKPVLRSCPRSTSSTTRTASRSASNSSSAAGRSPRSATPTATCRCCSGPRPAAARASALIVHTDAEREWAYDRKSHIGRLDKALDEAMERLDGRQHEGLEPLFPP